MARGKKIFRNATYLFVGEVVARFLTAVVSILVARYLGAARYGILSTALAFCAIVGFFTDAGLTHTLIREGTKPNSDTSRLLGGALKLRLFFAAGTTLATIILIAILFTEPSLRLVIYLVGMPMIWGGALQGLGISYFQMVQEMKYVALIRISWGMALCVMCLSAIFLSLPLEYIALAYGSSFVIGAALSMALIIRSVPNLGGTHPGLINGLGAFTLSGIFGLALPQLGPLILSKVTSFAEVGNFSVAYRIPSVLSQIPGVLARAFYPELFRLGSSDPATHLRLGVQELKFMALIAFALALPLAIYSDEFINLILGEEWSSDISPLLRLLIWGVVFESINTVLGDSLTTVNLQVRRTASYGVALLIGIFAYMLGGSMLGAFGGCLAFLLVQVLIFLLFIMVNPVGFKLVCLGLPRVLVGSLLTFSIWLAVLQGLWVGLAIVMLWLTYICFQYLLDSDLRNLLKGLVLNLKRQFSL
jgi:O-antigen/teichoic acid export membrane protein